MSPNFLYCSDSEAQRIHQGVETLHVKLIIYTHLDSQNSKRDTCLLHTAHINPNNTTVLSSPSTYALPSLRAAAHLLSQSGLVGAVALLHGPGQGAFLDEASCRLQTPSHRVHGTHVTDEEVTRVSRLTAYLGVKVESARLQSALGWSQMSGMLGNARRQRITQCRVKNDIGHLKVENKTSSSATL